MTATSSYDHRFAPHNGRLKAIGTCWQPKNPGTKDYLQLDLGGEYFICAVETQGNGKATIMEWTSQYKISLSSDNVRSIPYEEDGEVKVSSNCALNTCAQSWEFI